MGLVEDTGERGAAGVHLPSLRAGRAQQPQQRHGCDAPTPPRNYAHTTHSPLTPLCGPPLPREREHLLQPRRGDLGPYGLGAKRGRGARAALLHARRAAGDDAALLQPLERRDQRLAVDARAVRTA